MTVTERKGKKGISYNIRVFLGTDGNGKQIIKSMTWKPETPMTKRQARQEAYKIGFQFEQQCLQERDLSKKVTFRSVAEEWIATATATRELNISTLERMKKCRDRIYKAIGNVYIDELKYKRIQNFIISLSADGVNQRTGKGLSQKTQKHYITFISDVFNYAIKCELVESNPCRSVKAVKDKEKSEQQFYTLDEERVFLNLLNEKAELTYKVLFHLLAYYGLRRGEVLGLEWKDVDYAKQTISIMRTSKYAKGVGIYADMPKTASGQRTFVITEKTICLLQQLQTEQEYYREIIGNCWVNSDRICADIYGREPLKTTPKLISLIFYFQQEICCSDCLQ